MVGPHRSPGILSGIEAVFTLTSHEVLMLNSDSLNVFSTYFHVVLNAILRLKRLSACNQWLRLSSEASSPILLSSS